jgi:hypothetical protein
MKSFILGFILILAAVLSPAQQLTNAPSVDTNTVAANPTPAGQAPDDVVKKLSSLVHDGKYAEAQQLASGLLLAYPDDQRLLKAKMLLDKLIATSNSSQPTNSVAQPAASGTSEQLTGMDKVEYNSLIEMAKEAQQNTDLDQQKASLKQFMDESGTFLQKYPDQMLLWQIRAASALILDDPDAGYEAGQKLLGAGAADSNDPKLQQLLAKLKVNGWLDKQGMEQSKQKIEEDKKYGWLLGRWSEGPSYYSIWSGKGFVSNEIEFSKSDSYVEGYAIKDGQKYQSPAFRYTVADSEKIMLPANWECNLKEPPDWQPITSFTLGSDKKTMTIFIKQTANILTKISDSQGQPQ